MSRIYHQLRPKRTRGPDVAPSVSRLIFIRLSWQRVQCHLSEWPRMPHWHHCMAGTVIYTKCHTYTIYEGNVNMSVPSHVKELQTRTLFMWGYFLELYCNVSFEDSIAVYRFNVMDTYIFISRMSPIVIDHDIFYHKHHTWYSSHRSRYIITRSWTIIIWYHKLMMAWYDKGTFIFPPQLTLWYPSSMLRRQKIQCFSKNTHH